jgi:hypothetical protein
VVQRSGESRYVERSCDKNEENSKECRGIATVRHATTNYTGSVLASSTPIIVAMIVDPCLPRAFTCRLMVV